jgi:hypothetical protein
VLIGFRECAICSIIIHVLIEAITDSMTGIAGKKKSLTDE